MCCFFHYNGRARVLQHAAALMDALQASVRQIRTFRLQHTESYYTSGAKTAAANRRHKKRAG